jgi:hypothetical protein
MHERRLEGLAMLLSVTQLLQQTGFPAPDAGQKTF